MAINKVNSSMQHTVSGFANDKNNRDTNWDIPYSNSGNEKMLSKSPVCFRIWYVHKFRRMPVVKDNKWLQQGTCITEYRFLSERIDT
jgi:hypothetical protein